MNKPVKILLVDEQSIVRNGLKLLLEIHHPASKEVKEVSSCVEAFNLAISEFFDIVIMEVMTPSINGLQFIKKLRSSKKELPVIFFTSHYSIDLVKDSYTHGVNGYLLKSANIQEIVFAIDEVISKGVYFSTEISKILFESMAFFSKNERKNQICDISKDLSNREKEILQQIMNEKTNQEIADLLFISRRTVESHRDKLMKKLNVSTLTGLVKLIIESEVKRSHSS